MQPESLIQKRITLFGFILFGIASLCPGTLSVITKFNAAYQIAALFFVGLIWTLPSIGVLCTLHGRTWFEHMLSRHTARLGFLGITLCLLVQIGWSLPGSFFEDGSINNWSTWGFVFLILLAILGHGFSWIMVSLQWAANIFPADCVDLVLLVVTNNVIYLDHECRACLLRRDSKSSCLLQRSVTS